MVNARSAAGAPTEIAGFQRCEIPWFHAIRGGYDEITHINMVLMQAMPDSVVDASNTLARIEGPARHAKDVDLYADPMQSLIALMLREGTTVDPTLAALEKVYIGEDGDVQPRRSRQPGSSVRSSSPAPSRSASRPTWC